MTTVPALPAKVSIKVLASMRQASAALCALAAEMPAAAAAMSAFVQTLRTRLPADLPTDAAPPDAIAEDGSHEYDVLLWHDLLWYGHVKSAGVSASGFERDEVLADLRGQVARMLELPGCDRVRLRPVPVPGG